MNLPVQDITSPWSPVVLRQLPAHIFCCSFCTPTKCWTFFHQHAWWKILQNRSDAYLKVTFPVTSLRFSSQNQSTIEFDDDRRRSKEVNWSTKKKKLRHRLSRLRLRLTFCTWCAGWFGQIDFQTIPRIIGSTTYDYKDERRSSVWSVEQQETSGRSSFESHFYIYILVRKLKKIRLIG